MEHSPSVELSRQEAMTLIRIANEGDLGADVIDEGTVTRLQSMWTGSALSPLLRQTPSSAGAFSLRLGLHREAVLTLAVPPVAHPRLDWRRILNQKSALSECPIPMSSRQLDGRQYIWTATCAISIPALRGEAPHGSPTCAGPTNIY
jgi:hypothetical protein